MNGNPYDGTYVMYVWSAIYDGQIYGNVGGLTWCNPVQSMGHVPELVIPGKWWKPMGNVRWKPVIEIFSSGLLCFLDMKKQWNSWHVCMESGKLLVILFSGWARALRNHEESPAVRSWATPPCAHRRPTALQPTSSETMPEGRQRPPLLEHLARDEFRPNLVTSQLASQQLCRLTWLTLEWDMKWYEMGSPSACKAKQG